MKCRVDIELDAKFADCWSTPWAAVADIAATLDEHREVTVTRIQVVYFDD